MGYTSLHRAVCQGHLEVVRALAVAGSLVDCYDFTVTAVSHAPITSTSIHIVITQTSWGHLAVANLGSNHLA